MPILRVALLLAIVLSSHLSFAANGKISGRVTDQATREGLPGVNIMIVGFWEAGKLTAMDSRLGATSDINGYYVILNVPPGSYDIKASMVGYVPMIQKQVRVNMDRTITVDLALQQSAVEVGAVQVVAKREVIKADVSGTQEIITTERIAETPVLRVDEFVNKIKGVELVAGNDGHGLSIRGGAIRETDVRLDGVSVRDPRSENSYLSLNSTAVEELQVLTGGFEAKYGGFRSGLVNVVTKEGRRDKYSLAVKFDITTKHQRKFFGTNPWSDDSWIYRVFADTSATGYAWNGTEKNLAVPEELRYFKGWKNTREGRNNYTSIGLPQNARLTEKEKRLLWLQQHPQYTFADQPDWFLEGTLSGPLPGSAIPLWGEFAKRSTVMLAGKYENSQLAFPLGPRNDYVDWNGQFKIRTQLSDNIKLLTTAMLAKVNSLTAGRTSTFGGALIDNSSRFNFLASTEASVQQQAALLGGSAGFVQMFNKSRLQFFDQRYMIAGSKLTHTLSPKSFYTVDVQFSYNDHTLTPFELDSTQNSAWTRIGAYRVLNVPAGGTPNGSTNWLTDINNLFWLYGGLQAADSSYSWMADVNADYTAQIGRHHQVEAGVGCKYNHIYVNAGTWAQSEKSWTPDAWQYYTAKPMEVGAYAQDKLEFEGMIATVGVRADYFNPNKDYYIVQHPLDEDYANFYNLNYEYLVGRFGSWERWVQFRELLNQPPGWPTGGRKTQLKISPRLGVSFPITAYSKLYFNYGHFYQRPNVAFIYNQAVMPGAANVPSLNLDMAKTVAYEFGYEQRFLGDFLFNVTFYYKDVKDEPLIRSYIDYWEELTVNQYAPDAYKDIRGLEVRLEKNIGRFITFWGNYEYMLQSSGRSGLAAVYENRLRALEELRYPNMTRTDPLPRANLNLNLHTPDRWGPGYRSFRPLSTLYVNLFAEWRDGGQIIINPLEQESLWKRIDVVDYSNMDLRASKLVQISGTRIEVVLTVQNLLNQKRLTYGNMSTAQFDRYKTSLHLPYESGEQKGNDKMGDWNKDHIDAGWFTAPLFINPRRALIGVRITI
jgi:hypothetical protein